MREDGATRMPTRFQNLADGDKRLLQRHLTAMTKWIEWCRLHSTNLIRDKDRNGDYGDWLSIGADTPKDLIGTAYFAYSTHLLSMAYRAVGDDSRATQYASLFDDIVTAFNRRYVRADGRITGNTQCCYAMALKFELLPDALRPLAAKYLNDDIKAKGYVLTPGRYVGAAAVEADSEPFAAKMARLTATLEQQFAESARLETVIRESLRRVGYTAEAE